MSNKTEIFRKHCIPCEQPLVDIFPVYENSGEYQATCSRLSCPYSKKTYLARLTKDDVEVFESQVGK